ncbi:MAG: HD domain-containing protein [Sumerlaeia bacterium]
MQKATPAAEDASTPNGASSAPTSSPRIPCAELKEGQRIESTYLLAVCDQRQKKNGDPYFLMRLADASGSVAAVMWDRHDALREGRVKAEDIVFVDGQVAEFNGGLQVTVKFISRMNDEDVDVGEFLASSRRSRPEMEAELDALIESVTQPDCRRLLERFFQHKRLRELFCTAPAAARVHQAFLGGLLEHTLNVVTNALKLAERYQPYDRDLLITAGLLHDIGKVREYEWRRTISYTDDGRLLGHIFMGASMVEQAILKLDGFPELYRSHILHLILSHHGKMEFGSPVIPKTKEALILHYADYSDAFLTSFDESTAEARGRAETWTAYNRVFDTYLFAAAPGHPAELPAPGTEGQRRSPATMPSATQDRDPREKAAAGGGNVDDPG